MNVMRDLLEPNVPFGRSVRAWVMAVLAMFYVFIHIYAVFYGSPNYMLIRSLHVAVALSLVFFYLPIFKRPDGTQHPVGVVIDILLFVGALWIAVYFMLFLTTWEIRKAYLMPLDYFTGAIALGLTLEATRRAVGFSLVVISLVFIAHALFANYFPVPFFGPPASMDRLFVSLIYSDEGIFGAAIAVMVQFVVVFILFGTLLTVTGGGSFFSRIAFALFGHLTGGPAKASVVSSGFLGMLSGSAVGNVVTVGAFTIPLMRRLGYKPSFAGGVQAAASNGDIIMPPVMGGVAFIMAEFMNRSYVEIALAATIPAILYYLVIYLTVHFEARKLGLVSVSRSQMPNWKVIMRKQGYMLIPLILIILALVLGYSIVFVAAVIVVTTFVLGLIPSVNRLSPIRMFDAFEQTARSTVSLSATAACAGVIIGAVFATGLSFTISQWAVDATDGRIWLILLVGAFMAFILGLGMTAGAVYITMVVTVIPILVKAGVPEIAAHFFAFYWGNISNITPPVAFTAFAAAPIAKANPMTVGWQATRLGAATFLLPTLMVYAPALLLEGTVPEIVHVTISAGLSLTALALACTGYIFTHMSWTERGLHLVASALLIFPSFETSLPGAALFAAVTAFNWYRARKVGERAIPVQVQVIEEEETRAVVEPKTALGRRWAAFVAKRMEKEADGADLAVPQPPGEAQGAIIDMLMKDVEGPGAPKEVNDTVRTWAWAAIAATAIGFEAMGQFFLHATNPYLWTLCVFGLSLFATVSVVLLWARGRKSQTATPLPGDVIFGDG